MAPDVGGAVRAVPAGRAEDVPRRGAVGVGPGPLCGADHVVDVPVDLADVVPDRERAPAPWRRGRSARCGPSAGGARPPADGV
ncbi:hypothetical protein GCM10010495_08050 [Kitasatospora herbaricolor]|nr:hypothetical protein GCM10010495_08050 [Kitasatospora herbaricolor]